MLNRSLSIVAALALALAVVGCKPDAPPTSSTPSTTQAKTDKTDKTGAAPQHEEPADVPPTVVLGDHAYHAELFQNKTSGEVAVAISDGEFHPVSVPEKELFLTVTVQGQPKEFTLAQAEPGKEGKARFVLVSKELCDALGTNAKGAHLNATVKGKPYSASFGDKPHRHGKPGAAEDDHDHGDDHDHDHDGKDDHKH